jgi:hypothetical protein
LQTPHSFVLFLFVVPVVKAALSSFRIFCFSLVSSLGIFTHNTNFSSSSSSLLSLPLRTTIVFALTALCGFALFRRIANARGDDDDNDFYFAAP